MHSLSLGVFSMVGFKMTIFCYSEDVDLDLQLSPFGKETSKKSSPQKRRVCWDDNLTGIDSLTCIWQDLIKVYVKLSEISVLGFKFDHSDTQMTAGLIWSSD